MASAILRGLSNHSIKDILAVHFTLTDDDDNKREWTDFVKADSGEEAQAIITEKIPEYLAEIQNQIDEWKKTDGYFEVTDPFGKKSTQFIPQEEYVKPLGYSWDTLRVQRNELLRESDWTQLADSPVKDTDQQLVWEKYRKDLRDIPATYAADIKQVAWPAKPDEKLAEIGVASVSTIEEELIKP